MKVHNSKKQIGGFNDNANTVEALKASLTGVGQGVKDSLLKDMGQNSLDTFWSQILGGESPGARKMSGDMAHGEEINLKDLNKNERPQHIEAAYNYAEKILHGEKRIHAEDAQEIRVKIEEVMIEIRKLIDSSKELQVSFKEVSMENLPAKPGKYHLNFVEWLLSSIRDVRMKVEDSGAWTAMFASKKNKREYWSMFKKHGTSFGMSNERNVATQVG